jgi:uncharacterized protein with PIN domain
MTNFGRKLGCPNKDCDNCEVYDEEKLKTVQMTQCPQCNTTLEDLTAVPFDEMEHEFEEDDEDIELEEEDEEEEENYD